MYQKASFKDRFLAVLLDGIILLTLILVINLILSLSNLTFPIAYEPFLVILYNTLFIWKIGQTLGKKALNIKVVDQNYRQVGLLKALFRESIGKLISTAAVDIGYLWVLIDGKRESWHDKLAKTYVIKTAQNGVSIPITQEERPTLKQKMIFFILFFVFSVPVIPVIFFYLLYSFNGLLYEIRGDTMEPNFSHGQRYFVKPLRQFSHKITYGDVIVFVSPQNPEIESIKRVVALPHDSVSISGGVLFVNSRPLDESRYLSSSESITRLMPGSMMRDGVVVIVPANSYFVLGDNRDFSSDSREYGFISKDLIVGVVGTCFWNCNSSGSFTYP